MNSSTVRFCCSLVDFEEIGAKLQPLNQTAKQFRKNLLLKIVNEQIRRFSCALWLVCVCSIYMPEKSCFIYVYARACTVLKYSAKKSFEKKLQKGLVGRNK